MNNIMNISTIVVYLLWLHVELMSSTTWSLNAKLSAYKVASFSIPDDVNPDGTECAGCDPTWNHFDIHNVTGNVYVGGSNILVHLGPDFTEMNRVNTRVEQCPQIYGQDVQVHFEDCKNLNKLLIIYYGDNKLITCGSENDGKCKIRELDDISISNDNERSLVTSGYRTTAYIIQEDTLYIAATCDINRESVPPIRRFRISKTDPFFIDEDLIFITRDAKSGRPFVIHYVGEFVFSTFTYYVTTQRHDLYRDNRSDNLFYSKLNRVCHDADDFNSYAEITIECLGNNGESYNLAQAAHLGQAGSDLATSIGVNHGDDVLYAVFAKSINVEGDKASNQSAICVFKLDEIEQAFIDTIVNCFMGRNAVNEIMYLQSSDCTHAELPLELAQTFADLEKCHAVDYAHPKGSIAMALTSTAIAEWQNTLPTSIITTTERHHTIAFIGTADGTLMKLHIQSTNDWRVYETLALGSRVLRDMNLDAEKQHVTVLTELEIYKLAVENCSYFSTCEECIGFTDVDGDPYCGWCALERRCTRYKDCALPDESTRWLSYDETQCQQISNVAPSVSLPITVQQEITVTVDQLPDLLSDQSYECVFELDEISASNIAAKSGNDLRCMTPEFGQLPRIPDGTDHIVTLLSIRSTETGVKIEDTNHTFFECSIHTRCIDCVASGWDCDWCTYGNICTHDTGGRCPSDNDNTLIAGLKHQRVGPLRRGPSQCTQLEDHPEEVLLAAGVERYFNITVKNLPDVNLGPADRYECILYIEGKDQRTAAERIGDNTIRCLKKQFTYDAEIQELTSSLTLQWAWEGIPITIDDEFGFEVTLFKCALRGPDCSRCVSALTTRHALRCGWCSGIDSCAVQDHPQCIGPWIREIPDVGVVKKNCPIPIIHSIWPSSGPIEGNTLIEINGTDLGRTFSNIRMVTVADQPCSHVEFEDMFVPSDRLYCRTTPGQTDSVGDVIITVEGIDTNSVINDGGTTFTYRNPAILEFYPIYGPEAGGTMVTIKGNDLLTGRDIGIQIGNASCSFDRYSSTPEEVVCLTGPSYEGDLAPFSVTFDESERRSSKDYTYRGDPVIDQVLPRSAFKAGGRVLTVNGRNLDVVATPQVLIQVGGESYTEKCMFVNGSATVMTCTSPRVDLPTRKRRQVDEDNNITPVELGFIMDGANLRMWSKENDVTFNYFEDPTYFPLEMNETEVVQGGPLKIKGERLNLASSDSDVTVYIGDTKCTDISLGLTALTCTVPDSKPSGETTESGGFPLSVIQGNLRFDNIGSVRFAQTETGAETPIITILGSSIAVILLFVIAGIILSVFYHRRQKKIITETKNILLERIRNLKLEADRMFNELQAGAQIDTNASIQLSNNISINLEDVKIHYDQLAFGRSLGQGEFGKVFLATLSLGDGVNTNVAVKTIKDDTDATFAVKFLEEAMIMKNCDHPNVLSLLGLTFDPNGSPLVVLPFMKNGDLRSFLLKDNTTINGGQMLNFALDGAKGMSYLSEQKFVHRDLAARNCMIDETLSLKIADFGLSRDLHESDYYRSGDRKAKLPVKWMAPESLAKRIFTTQTDVWSFGIVLWEMFSRGSKPYIGIPNRDIYQHITRGNRMECPPQCPPEMYSIMEKCWQGSPKLRPSFQQIVKDIESVIRFIQSAISHEAVHLAETSGERDALPYYATPISSGVTDTAYEVQPSDGGNSNLAEDAPEDANIYEVQQPVEIEMVTRPQSHQDNPIYSNDSVVYKYRR